MTTEFVDVTESLEVPEPTPESPVIKTVDEWKRVKGTSQLEFYRTQVWARWPAGKELTESAYDLAIESSDFVAR